MPTDEGIKALRTQAEEKRAAFVAARKREEYLFVHRFNGNFDATAAHFQEWREEHANVMKALNEWQVAVNAYLASMRR